MGRKDKTREITGGILGLGGSTVPKEPGDPSAANDRGSKQRRRERLDQGEAESTPAVDREHSGATGVDMGGGGHGTDVSGR